MKRFLETIIFGNSVKDLLVAAGIILFVFFLNKLISRYLATLICKVFKRNWKSFDEQKFVDLVIHPLSVFLTAFVSIIVLYGLVFPPELNVIIYKYPLQRIIHAIGTIVLIATFIWLLLRMIDFIANLLEAKAAATIDQSDNQLILFFKDLLKVILGVIGLLMIIHFAFDYNIGNLLTGLSIVGAAIALSLRESLENLIASFVIFFDKPFTTGDLVKVQNITGNVERIGLRSTRIRTGDKSYVTVPNKQMVDSILDNISLRSQIRGELNLHINLRTAPGKIEVLIAEIKGFLNKIDEVQTANVLFTDIRLQSFVVVIEFFTMPIEWSRFTAIKQELNLFILQAMEKADINIAAEGKDIAIVP
ncbi:MAG TPA: mechanosensitive ion channel family protein [Flavisolibacter sp.]|nr:mechanosensitive ion channel family protein [Flavisolibacter sp.]